LQEPVIAERVRCLFEIGCELIGLHAAEYRDTKVRNDDRAAANAIRIVIVGAVPRFEEELPIPFAPRFVPGCDQPDQLIAHVKEPAWFSRNIRRAFRRSDRSLAGDFF